MTIFSEKFTFKTSGRGTILITDQLNQLISKSGIDNGLCHVFVQHTSASLIFCENADDTVRHDLESFMRRLVPDGDSVFRHRAEGPDDMPAHLRTILTQNSLMIPIENGRLALGVWQGVYLWEHRLQGHQRNVLVSIF